MLNNDITWEELKTGSNQGIKARFVKKTDDILYGKDLKIGEVYELMAQGRMVAVLRSNHVASFVPYELVNKCFERYVDMKTDKLEVGTKLKYVRKYNGAYLCGDALLSNLTIGEVYEISKIDKSLEFGVYYFYLINNKSEHVVTVIDDFIDKCFEIYVEPITSKNKITIDQLKTGTYIKCVKPIEKLFTNSPKYICEVGDVYQIKMLGLGNGIASILDKKGEFIIPECPLWAIVENFEIYKRTIKDVKVGDIVRSLIDTEILKKGSKYKVVGFGSGMNGITLMDEKTIKVIPVIKCAFSHIEQGNISYAFEFLEEDQVQEEIKIGSSTQKEGFIIWRENSKDTNNPTVIHFDIIEAEKECERLSQKFVGERFHVLKSVKSCVTKVVTCNKVEWE